MAAKPKPQQEKTISMKPRLGGLFGAACLLLSFVFGSADAWSSASSDPSCDGSTIVLELEEQATPSMAFSTTSTSKKGRRPTFYALPSPFGPWPSLPANASAAIPSRLLVAEPIDACKELAISSGNASSSFALLIARGGGCSFLEKVMRAKEAGAASVVLFNADGQGCVYLGVGNASSPDVAPSRKELEALPLTVSVDAATGARLLVAAASDASTSTSSSSSSSSTLLRIFEPLPSGLIDGSALVLGALAVCGLLIGALLASRDEVERRVRKRRQRRTSEGNAAADAASAEGEEQEVEDEDEPLAFSSLSDVAFVVALMASALLAAFFFPKIFSVLLAALFVFGSGEATGSAASLLFARVFPWMKEKEIALPSLLPASLWGKEGSSGSGQRDEEEREARNDEGAPTAAKTKAVVRASTLAGFALVALPCALAWLLRGPRRVWPLHDLLALALISSIPTGLRLPSFRACCALLLLAACNDVFFVFLQPMITGGRSVMVAVATATPALVLLSPLQQGGPRAGFALLGFGDVVVPGACVAFAARWDSLRRLKKISENASSSSSSSPPSFSLLSCFSSLWASVAGYAMGLCLTYFALYHRFGNSAGQPALLYLGPCVLFATAAALGSRGGTVELRAAWRGLDGKSSSRLGDDSESSALLAA